METPFSEDELEEVHLSPSSLIKAIVQLKFPQVLKIERFVPALQRRIEKWYPILRPEFGQEAIFGPEGVISRRDLKIFRFWDIEQKWSVVLSETFVALETSSYTTRADLVHRIEVLLAAMKGAKAQPVVVDRLGVRYTNRITGPEIEESLHTFVRPEIFGPIGIRLPAGMELAASVGQVHFRLDGLQLQARWGRVGPNASVVPDIEPIATTSWLLDIDVFDERSIPFDPTSIAAAARHASVHAYHFFRWAMTDSFIEGRRAR